MRPIGRIQNVVVGKEIPAAAYYAMIGIRGTCFEALIDTGSAITLISQELYDHIPRHSLLRTTEKTSWTIQGIVETAAAVSMAVTVQLELGSFKSEPHEVWVVERSSQPFVLGLDFLDKYGIEISTRNRRLEIRSPESMNIPLRVVDLPGGEDFKVACRSTTIVPPRSKQLVEVSIRDLKGDVEGCIEPLLRMDSELLVARSVNRVCRRTTMVECVNLNSYPIKVERNQVLATFSR